MSSKKQTDLTCAEAAALYTPPKKPHSIKIICERDQGRQQSQRRYPGAYKRTERLWMIPIDDVLNDIERNKN